MPDEERSRRTLCLSVSDLLAPSDYERASAGAPSKNLECNTTTCAFISSRTTVGDEDGAVGKNGRLLVIGRGSVCGAGATGGDASLKCCEKWLSR